MPTLTYPNLGKPAILPTLQDLFRYGEPGVAYDAFDMSSLFQDTAGISPATDAGQKIALVMDRIHATHAYQSSVSLRPLIGRAPKDRRNLLTNSELFATDIANASGGSATATTAVSPPSVAAQVCSFTEDTANSVHCLFVLYPFKGTVNSVGSIYLKAAGRSRVSFGVSGGLSAQAQFDLSTGQFVGAANGVVATPVGDGWYRLSRVRNVGEIISMNIYAANDAGATTYLGDGRVAFYMTAAQLEENVSQVATAYQRVRAAVDMTEAGVPSYPFVRLDLSDDRLDTVLPQAVTGDVVIAGRNGTLIAPASYAAGSTFRLGPTSYTGGVSNILRAVGDVVGWTVIGRTLTAAERKWLLDYYKERGAKGLLVPGPELVVNGTFDTNVSGWSPNPGQTSVLTFDAGRARLDVSSPASTGNPFATQSRTLDITKSYLFSCDYQSDPTMSVRFFVAQTEVGSNDAFIQTYPGGVGRALIVFRPSAAAQFVGFQTVAPQGRQGWFDNISVRELRPEEEW